MTQTNKAVVIGGGHNGLVSATYLAKSGIETTLIEKRSSLGGVVGSYEYMPGYRSSITNSPGSFESRIIEELELKRHGLRFYRPNITVAQRFGESTFLGFRDRNRIANQLNVFANGEYDRYRGLIDDLNMLGKVMGLSIWENPLSVDAVRLRLNPNQQALFDKVVYGSLMDLLDSRLQSDQAKSLLMMLALPGTMLSAHSPGSALGLMLRPISMASLSEGEDTTASSMPLRGSTGIPYGSMSAIINALESSAREAGVNIVVGNGVSRVLKNSSGVSGVLLENGDVLGANKIVSTIEPSLLQSGLLEDEDDLVPNYQVPEPKGATFKLALALDRLPNVPGLPEDVSSEEVLGSQIRIGSSSAHIEGAIQDGLQGRTSEEPIMWGMVPSFYSPELAPEGHHLFSINVWHAPYSLGQEYWKSNRDLFAKRCIDALDKQLPGLSDSLVGMSALAPTDIEKEFNLTGSDFTHGPMIVDNFFSNRIHSSLSSRKAALPGLYLGGSESWPGGYVTGAPGRNAAASVIRDVSLLSPSTL